MSEYSHDSKASILDKETRKAIEALSSDSSDSDTDYEDLDDFGILKSYNKAIETITAKQHIPYLNEDLVKENALLEDVFVKMYKKAPELLHGPIYQMQSGWQTFVKVLKSNGSLGLYRSWSLLGLTVNYSIHFLLLASNSWRLFIAFLMRAILQSDRIITCTLLDRKINECINNKNVLPDQNQKKSEEKSNEKKKKKLFRGAIP